jgi:hypothetical protein
MADWRIRVCPKCHALAGEDTGIPTPCPHGCERPMTTEEATSSGGKFGEMRPIACIAIDVVPTNIGTVTLINSITGYTIIP